MDNLDLACLTGKCLADYSYGNLSGCPSALLIANHDDLFNCTQSWMA